MREFNALEYREIIYFADMLENEERKKAKADFIAVSWGAWLTGAGDKKTFKQFLSALGLAEKVKPLTVDQRQVMIDKSNAIADRILAMSKRGKSNGKKKYLIFPALFRLMG